MYKPGNIIKICVTNFVTYTYAEMHPAPHLNMIIGSNGTGKSTMAAAIILGLGGNPKIVGRGSKVSEYVKHHCNKARIDIVLQANDSRHSNIITITREFDLHDKSTWKINGKTVSQKDMQEKIKLYNIQVDNLCQFLPQDRVQDFAKMNKQELLKQTKKALCQEDLIKKQENLIQKRSRQKTISDNFEKDKKKLEQAKDANRRVEGKVKNFKRRQEFGVSIKNIDRKIAWKKYDEIIEKRNEIRAEKECVAAILKEHKNSAAPKEAAIKRAETTVSKLKNKIKQDEQNIRVAAMELQKNNSQWKQLKDSIKEIKLDVEAKIREIEQRAVEIRTAHMKLAKLQSDKDELLKVWSTDTDIDTKIQHYNQEIKEISSHISELEEKKSELLESKRERTHEIRALEHEIKKIENIKQQRLEYLRNHDMDAYKATLWLRNNEHNFQGQVFEPMMLELNVIKPENAIYIENTLSASDRVAITCTSKDDMNVLIREFRDTQKLAVNIVYSDAQENLDIYQPPVPIESLKEFGLYAYLVSLVNGPLPIIAYLCKNYKIHCTPVGNGKTNQCVDVIPANVSTFFSDKFRFSCSYSRYTREKIVRQNEIKSNGSLSISLDLTKLQDMQRQLTNTQKSYQEDSDEIQNIQSGVTQLTENKKKLVVSLKELRDAVQRIKTVDSQIRVVNNNIQVQQDNVTTPDEIKKGARDKIKAVVKQMVNLQKVIVEKYERITNLRNSVNLEHVKVRLCEKRVTVLENEIHNLRQLCQESEQNLKTIKQSYLDITKTVKQALQKGRELSNGFAPDDEEFNEFREEYDQLSDCIEELVQQKNEIVARMECLNSADEAEMRDYEDRLKQIEKLEDSLQNHNAKMGNFTRKMEQMESEYLTSLQALVDQISSRFSAAFEKMGCAGDVSIYTGNNSKDYGQYGLSIKVTYRDGVPLQELNNVVQSGGERAVATAAFMLSLQELTPAPFRCVDEINQGMDEINERRIFELLFELTAQPNTAQYFLITPKLIPNLNYTPSMKIHFVHNGPYVPSQAEWDRSREQ